VHVAGDGTELKNIRETVAQLSLGSVVSVLGSVSKERRESLFASSSLFVMPNIPLPGDMEGFGIVCIEAAGRGVPVVAADLEGITDAVIPEETGLLFRPHEVDHAAMTIVEALRRDWDPEQVRSSCLKHFDIQIIASRYVEHVFR
jgi:glycosyltransferase involved in cell wall biosynthesis